MDTIPHFCFLDKNESGRILQFPFPGGRGSSGKYIIHTYDSFRAYSAAGGMDIVFDYLLLVESM